MFFFKVDIIFVTLQIALQPLAVMKVFVFSVLIYLVVHKNSKSDA